MTDKPSSSNGRRSSYGSISRRDMLLGGTVLAASAVAVQQAASVAQAQEDQPTAHR